jgi:hypothetical protein
MSPSASRIFAARRERLQRPNLLYLLDGRAWTTNRHQDRVTLFSRNEAAARTPPHVGRASRLMIETQIKTNEAQNQLLNRISTILTI